MERLASYRPRRQDRRRDLDRHHADDVATVAAVMSTAIAVDETASVESLKSLFTDHRIGAVAVVDRSGVPVGFVTPRDLMTEDPLEAHECELVTGEAVGLHFEPSPRRVRDVMMPFAFSVDETTPIATAAKLMVFEGISHVAIVDRRRRIVGVVSALDVVRHALRRGEIS